MDIVIAFVELIILVIGYLIATVINKPFWFIVFALVWFRLVIWYDRKE